MGAGLWVFLMSSPSHRLNTEENALLVMLPGTFMNTVPVPYRTSLLDAQCRCFQTSRGLIILFKDTGRYCSACDVIPIVYAGVISSMMDETGRTGSPVALHNAQETLHSDAAPARSATREICDERDDNYARYCCN